MNSTQWPMLLMALSGMLHIETNGSSRSVAEGTMAMIRIVAHSLQPFIMDLENSGRVAFAYKGTANREAQDVEPEVEHVVAGDWGNGGWGYGDESVETTDWQDGNVMKNGNEAISNNVEAWLLGNGEMITMDTENTYEHEMWGF